MLKHKHTVVVVVFILQWMGELENKMVFIFATFSFKPSKNYIICADFERSFSDAQTIWSIFCIIRYYHYFKNAHKFVITVMHVKKSSATEKKTN